MLVLLFISFFSDRVAILVYCMAISVCGLPQGDALAARERGVSMVALARIDAIDREAGSVKRLVRHL
jgi:hypothetical protein